MKECDSYMPYYMRNCNGYFGKLNCSIKRNHNSCYLPGTILELCLSMYVNPFQSCVCSTKQVTDFSIKRNTELKWVK